MHIRCISHCFYLSSTQKNIKKELGFQLVVFIISLNIFSLYESLLHWILSQYGVINIYLLRLTCRICHSHSVQYMYTKNDGQSSPTVYCCNLAIILAVSGCHPGWPGPLASLHSHAGQHFKGVSKRERGLHHSSEWGPGRPRARHHQSRPPQCS